jgi:predicted dehydrogenase
MKTYRLAIIGLGRMGSTIDAEVENYPAITLPYSIAAAALKIPRLEIVAGCDLIEAKNQAFQERWGVKRTYQDFQKMLGQEQLDMVAICTPGKTHAWMTLECARAGVAMIYCEKAMACKMTDADAARKLVESKHIAYNTGVLRRFDPRYHKARDLIREGKIGTPRALVHYAPATLLHGHIHSVDTMLFLLGDPPVRSVWGELRPRTSVIENRHSDKDPLAVYHFEMELKSGVVVEASTVPAGNWDFEVIGDEGVLRSLNNNIDWELRLRQPLGKKFFTFAAAEYPKVEPRSATVRCLEDLLDAHEQHRPALGSIDRAHLGTEVCLAAAESHLLGGRRVALPMKMRDLEIIHF